VAVIAPFKIGIDVEKVESRPDALAHYFCSHEELVALENEPRRKDELLTFFWSRKEAISKFLQLGGKMNFKQISTVKDEMEISQQKIRLMSGMCDGYWVSIAVELFFH
jgi:phosphopantetheinyl transferase (holo-ACP synthase)